MRSLDSSVVEVRVAAAHCIALLAQASYTVMSVDDDEDDDEEEGSYRGGGVSQVVGDVGMSTYRDSDDDYDYGEDAEKKEEEEEEEEQEQEQGLENFVGVTEDEVPLRCPCAGL